MITQCTTDGKRTNQFNLLYNMPRILQIECAQMSTSVTLIFIPNHVCNMSLCLHYQSIQFS